MNKIGIILLIIISISVVEIPSYSSAQNPNSYIFREIRGLRYNNTDASFYGVEFGGMQLIIVAGSPKDNISLQLILIQRSTDLIIIGERRSDDIKSTIITVIEYPGLVFRKFSNINRTIDFATLDWSLNTSRNRISSSEANLNVTASAIIINHPDSDLNGLKISFTYKFKLKISDGSINIPIYEIKNQETKLIGADNRTGKIISSSVKVDHQFFDPELDNFRFVLLPFNLRYFYLLTLPRQFTRPKREFNATENADNRVTITNPLSYRTIFEWIRTVEVDGVNKNVTAGRFKTSRSLNIRLINNTHRVVRYNLNSVNYFVYPSGERILHDPLFSASNYINPIKEVSSSQNNNSKIQTINIDTTDTQIESLIKYNVKLQFASQLIGLLIITVSFIFYVKRKYRNY